MQVNGTRMLRVRAVAVLLDVSPQTIYRAIEAGQLVALRIGSSTGALRVPESALAAFAEQCKSAARHELPESRANEVPGNEVPAQIESSGGAA